MKWLASTLRLTAFPHPSSQANSSTWWETVIGQPPDNRQVQPKTGVLLDEGSFETGKLILNVQPIRVDWLFIPTFDQETNSPAVSHLATFQSAVTTFVGLAERWFNICPSLVRLAFGAVLDIPVTNRPDGYRRLMEFLPGIQLDADGSSDFLYQINRPRVSRYAPTLRINRLSKWSVAMATSAQIVLGPRAIHYAVPGQEYLSARLELDINTAADFQEELSREQFAPLFLELIELGKEIAMRGDIA